jgi:hypothetical protein
MKGKDTQKSYQKWICEIKKFDCRKISKSGKIPVKNFQ